MIDPFAADGRDANLGGPALGYDRDPQLTELPGGGRGLCPRLAQPRPVTEFERALEHLGHRVRRLQQDQWRSGGGRDQHRHRARLRLGGGTDYRLTSLRRSAWRSPAARPTGVWRTALAAATATPSRPASTASGATPGLICPAPRRSPILDVDRSRRVCERQFTAKFNAKVYGGRIEAGYRVAVTPLAGLTPYAAVQSQVYRTPDYIETDVSGGGSASPSLRAASPTRALKSARASMAAPRRQRHGCDFPFAARLGARLGQRQHLTARSRRCPARASSSTAPAAPKSLLLANTAAELRLTPATSVTVKLDTEMGHGSQTYASTATLRYRW